MGCGKSKHAVATADTLAKSKSRSKSLDKSPPPVVEDRAKSDVDHVHVNEAKNPADHGKVKDDHEIKKVETDQKAEKKTDGKEQGNDGVHGNGESAIAAADVVVVEENKNGELKGLGKEEKVEKEVEVEVDRRQEDQGKLMVSHDSSPNDFFSPQKEHGETIESIITDGVSGKSDYYSPRAKGKPEGNDALEGKGIDGEDNLNKEKEEALKVDEGEKVAPADETKASGEEKTPVPAADNEKADAASTTVAKAD